MGWTGKERVISGADVLPVLPVLPFLPALH
jgi:hypothetical protein